MLLCLAVPREEAELHRGIGYRRSAGLTFLVSLLVRLATRRQMNHVVKWDWAASLRIISRLGIDGISLWLVLLTTFLMPIVLLSTVQRHHRKGPRVHHRRPVLERPACSAPWRSTSSSTLDSGSDADPDVLHPSGSAASVGYMRRLSSCCTRWWARC